MVTDPETSPSAGWYPDPTNPIRERLWDGVRWSEQVRPAVRAEPTPPVASPPAHRRAIGEPGHRADERRRAGSAWSTGSIVGLGIGLFALLTVGGCVALVGVVPFVAARSQESFVQDEVEFEIARPVPTMVPMTVGPEPFEEFAPTTAVPDFEGNGEQDFSFGSTAVMGWILDTGEPMRFEVTVGEPTDITDEVLSANPLNAEPLDGVVQVGIPVTVLVTETPLDPLPTVGLFDWMVVGGSTAAVYRPVESGSDEIGCNAIDDRFAVIEDLAVGDERFGRVCIPVPIADFSDPATHVSVTIGDRASATWRR